MCSFFCIFLLIFLSIWAIQSCNARIFTSDIHHRFSGLVKNWSESSRSNFFAGNWPEKGSVEYYFQLANHDHLLRYRRRRLSGSQDLPLTFSDGNATFRISSLGFLHYTMVSLGTPGMKFMVALDTGSDLFWVPCDCTQCAPIEDAPDDSDFELSIYSPVRSSTSKKVTCGNSFCTHQNSCGILNNCPYSVSYVSSETSTSGILMEDVLHFKSEDRKQEAVETYITFGCGQVQTGSFLDVAAPDGLFGLGLEKISVPSILSREGYTANSFSMCFRQDGNGRIDFGDKGSLDQEETPFDVAKFHPSYNITLTQIRVGTTLINLDFPALFDSGTSFTYLINPAYKRLTESFHSQIQDKRRAADPRIPFEYCYDMSPDKSSSLIPSMSLTLKGGGQLAVIDPIVIISTPRELVYCLAVIRSADLNIIGQNFMTGYRIVFNREDRILGWEKSDCQYVVEDSSSSHVLSRNSTTVPPAVAAGVGDRKTPDSATEAINRDKSSVASQLYIGYTSNLTKISFRFLVLLFLLL
ncbi:aspartyl protease family protein 1 [Daucus carota subsp. sativus]|uniref:aspartyl protease family protein 1 n=1 Tax=Daucus carota subsp. sativus TaxID=79200 RepID=UPI0007EF8389|nr:PREDICTED: aspartyl protease family protein 1 [Daucus carota subsp. sativus]